MAMTRSKTAAKTAKRKMYAARTRKSHCRGLVRAKCRHTEGCKVADGTKRSFCRKGKNVKA